MKYEDYNDPIYTVWSLDENGNYRPVKVTNEVRLVRYGMCIMKGIPDEGYGVSIDGMIEVKDKEELAKDEFQVDYTYGLIRFNPSIDKKEIVLKEYWAKGNYYYPAHRLYWTIDELTGRVTTVHDVIQYIIDYYEGTKKQIQQMIDDFRKELADEWQKLLDKFAEFQRVFNKAELTKIELEKLLVESLSTYQDLTNVVDVAKKIDSFTGIAQKTKVTLDNTEFPLMVSKEGNELGLVKDGLKIDNVFEYSEMVIKFKANENVKNPIIYNYKTKEFIKVNINMKQGDIISIATSFYKTKASLYTKNEKHEVIDITDKLEINTSYFYISVGNNTYFIDSEKGIENLEGNIFFNKKILEKNNDEIKNLKFIESINGKTNKRIELKAKDINCEDGKSIEENLKEISNELKKDNKVIKDDNNNKNYKIGIENGLLYYMEVE